MFKFFKKNLIKQHAEEAAKFIEKNLLPRETERRQSEQVKMPEIKFSISRRSDETTEGIQYSLKGEEDFEEIIDTQIEKTFTEIMIEHIREKGFKDPEVYKAARIDRRLFSKIISDRWYKPSKDTVTAIVLGLRLDIDAAEDLYSRAGFTLSHSSKRDIVIEYFIIKKMYDLTVINAVLYELGERVIGR